MRTIKRVLATLALAAGLVTGLPNEGVTAYAAQADQPAQSDVQPGRMAVYNHFYNRDVEFRGAYSSDRTYVAIDRHWQVRRASLHLVWTASQLAASQALTAYVNDKPVYSEQLTGRAEGGSRELEIALPADALVPGSNEIRIEVGRTDGKLICTYDQNDGVWVLLHKTSYMHVQYEETAPTAQLNEYPYPFVRAGVEPASQGSSIVVPDDADEEELAAALQVAASLGAAARDRDLKLHVAAYSDLMQSERKRDHLLYVGKLKHLPSELLTEAPQEIAARAEQGAMLYRFASPYASGKVIMVLTTARDDGMLDTAARLLLNSDLVSQMADNAAYIPQGADIGIAEQPNAERLTLQELGYAGGIQVRGPNRQLATVGIRLPSNQLLLPGAKVALNIRYARNIDFARSLVTLYVNGTPAGSRKLEPERADEDLFEVNIPANAVRSGYVELTAAFDFQMAESDCARMENHTPWGYIDRDSTVYLPVKQERALLLEHYPWPFVKNGKWNDAAVVLPDSGKLTELDFLADLAAYMGRELRDNSASLRVVRERDVLGGSADYNLIVAGTPERLQTIRRINDRLWFRYDDQFNYFLSNEKRRLLESFSRQLASIQLIASPFGQERGLLAVTAPRREQLAQAGPYLTEGDMANALAGNALLADRWEQATNHYFIAGDSLSLTDRVSMSSTEFKIFAVVFGTIVLLLLTGLVLYVRKYRRR